MKVALITLGCPKNLVDAEVMLGLLDRAGHRLTGEPDGADVTIVNTCSFIAPAVEESRAVIEDCLGLKRSGRLGAVVIAGCLPQRYGEETLQKFPDVDGVVGCSSFHRIVEVVEAAAEGGRPVLVEEPVVVYDDLSPRILGTPSHIAYVKIAEGCDNRCSYCTIPSIRGRLRSRPPDSIVREAAALVQAGVVELNIIAQDTTAYGTDIASGTGLDDLVRRIDRVGAEWVRLLYTHPAHVTDELLRAMSESDSVMPYLDMPIQHVADGVLRAMGRGVTGGRIRSIIEKARALVPGLAVRSSVMVGFPGETEDDFLELLRFVADGYVDHLGVFAFSPEPGTAAAAMVDRVPAGVAAARAAAVHEEAARVAAAAGAALAGSTVRVLVDEPGVGRMATQAWELDGNVIWETNATDAPEPGRFAEMRIQEWCDFDLVALHEEPGG